MNIFFLLPFSYCFKRMLLAKKIKFHAWVQKCHFGNLSIFFLWEKLHLPHKESVSKKSISTRCETGSDQQGKQERIVRYLDGWVYVVTTYLDGLQYIVHSCLILGLRSWPVVTIEDLNFSFRNQTCTTLKLYQKRNQNRFKYLTD